MRFGRCIRRPRSSSASCTWCATSLRYVADQDSRAVVTDLKRIYRAPTVAEVEQVLETLAEHWDRKYSSLSTLWLQHWEHVITAFDYPEDIRRDLHDQRHRVTQQRHSQGHQQPTDLPSDRSALKVVCLAIEQAAKKWTMPVQDWKQVLNRFAI